MYDMILCISCGREIGSLFPLYYKLIEDKKDPVEIFKILNLDPVKSGCCRSKLITNVRFNEYY